MASKTFFHLPFLGCSPLLKVLSPRATWLLSYAIHRQLVLFLALLEELLGRNSTADLVDRAVFFVFVMSDAQVLQRDLAILEVCTSIQQS